MSPRPPTIFVIIASSILSYNLVAVPSLAAGDLKAGRKKALECQTCHGLDGVSKLPEAPNLSGQVETYLVKALNDYRSGARTNEMMSLVAPTLSDGDVADLAAWYASIEITVQTPR
jgi:cytochrome c553